MAKCVCHWPTTCDGNGSVTCRMPTACMCACDHRESCLGCEACDAAQMPWDEDDDVGVEDVP